MLALRTRSTCWSAEAMSIPGTANVWHPPYAGQKKYVNGQLVAKSIDIYLCMEFADGGDVSP